MATLKETIQADVKDAMRARNQEVLTTLRGITAAIKQVEIDTREELDDNAVLDVLNKEVKKRRDAIKFASEGGRDDIVEQNQAELKILGKYVGEELSEEKLREIIQALVANGANNIGAVMGTLNRDYKGRFEGKLASQIVKEILS